MWWAGAHVCMRGGQPCVCMCGGQAFVCACVFVHALDSPRTWEKLALDSALMERDCRNGGMVVSFFLERDLAAMLSASSPNKALQ